MLVSLCEFLLTNHKDMLSSQQTKDLKILELTARIFQLLVQHESILQFDAYKRHHSEPALIVEQLLMNSHIELCSKTLKILREGLVAHEPQFSTLVNDMLVKYARKALELKGLSRQYSAAAQDQTTMLGGSGSASVSRAPSAQLHSLSDFDSSSKRFSLTIPASAQRLTSTSKSRKQSHPIDQMPAASAAAAAGVSLSPNINIIASSSPSSNISSSFKNFYKFGSSSQTAAATTANMAFNNNL